MSSPACGLDFGTSNSTFGIAEPGHDPALIALEGEHVTIPSAIFFSFEDGEAHFGRNGIAEYVDGAEGRMLRALKSVLGSALMKDTTRILGRSYSFTEIISLFLGELRSKYEHHTGHAPENVVAGRPVRFVDENDEADKLAESQLYEAIRGQGFKNIEFQFEPIAAALDYERQVNAEELAIVADIGGGTSDFTIVRLSPERAKRVDRANDILATAGVHVGGTDFDRVLSLAQIMPLLGMGTLTADGKRQLPRWPFHDLATWHRINHLQERSVRNELKAIGKEAQQRPRFAMFQHIVEERLGHMLAGEVENAKIGLTDSFQVDFQFEVVDQILATRITRDELDGAIAETADKIPAAMRGALVAAGIAANDIQTVIVTGGSTRLHAVRNRLGVMFENARIVETDAFGSVGMGLTLDALKRF